MFFFENPKPKKSELFKRLARLEATVAELSGGLFKFDEPKTEPETEPEPEPETEDEKEENE